MSRTPKFDALNTREKAWVTEYKKTLNGSEASRALGYSVGRANRHCAEMLRRPTVQAALEEWQQLLAYDADITVAETVKALARILRANMLDYMRVNEDGEPVLDFGALTRDTASVISELEVRTLKTQTIGEGEDARVVTTDRARFKLHDKISAADKLLRHLGGYAPQKHEHEHSARTGLKAMDDDQLRNHLRQLAVGLGIFDEGAGVRLEHPGTTTTQ